MLSGGLSPQVTERALAGGAGQVCAVSEVGITHCPGIKDDGFATPEGPFWQRHLHEWGSHLALGCTSMCSLLAQYCHCCCPSCWSVNGNCIAGCCGCSVVVYVAKSLGCGNRSRCRATRRKACSRSANAYSMEAASWLRWRHCLASMPQMFSAQYMAY